jgi:hypothetical protein
VVRPPALNRAIGDQRAGVLQASSDVDGDMHVPGARLGARIDNQRRGVLGTVFCVSTAPDRMQLARQSAALPAAQRSAADPWTERVFPCNIPDDMAWREPLKHDSCRNVVAEADGAFQSRQQLGSGNRHPSNQSFVGLAVGALAARDALRLAQHSRHRHSKVAVPVLRDRRHPVLLTSVSVVFVEGAIRPHSQQTVSSEVIAGLLDVGDVTTPRKKNGRRRRPLSARVPTTVPTAP